MRVARRLWPFCRRHTALVIWATVSMAVLSALGMIRPYLTKELIDRVIIGQRYGLLPWLAAGVVAVSAGRGVFNYVRQYLGELFGQRVVFDLRLALYRRLSSLPFSYYDTAKTGDLMSRLTGDVEAVRAFASFGFVHIMDFFFMLTFILIILFMLNVQLTLVSLAGLPFLAVIVVLFDRKIRPAFTLVQRSLSSLTARIQESITGVRVVKAFAREGHELDVFAGRNRDFMERNRDAAMIWARYIPAMDFFSGLSSTTVILFGGWLYIQDRITLGTLVAFTSYIGTLIWTTRELGWLINILEHSLAAGERLVEILDTRTTLPERANAVEVGRVSGHVRFEGVSFAYDGQHEVLSGVNLEAPAGALTAVVGETGSGKTTLLSLIPRFYDCSAGRVTIDGVDVRDMRLAELRANVGVALQETFLFSTSIRENIAYGKVDAGAEEVAAAARAAQAEGFIRELPEGYDTVVGERGIGLSGGQKQRVAIARALLVDPRVLILDDSTSSVDMETEYLIQKAMATLMKGRTTFVIAHRLSTVKSADQIVVLERGQIAERGTHAELLAAGGRYRAIYDVQFRDQEEITARMADAAGGAGGGEGRLAERE
jgi:ATP-binding cassette subfamily B multidrug efflux pump